MIGAAPRYRAELCQWPTPPALALRIGRAWPQLFLGARVLEPSAGSGNLVRLALEMGASHVTAVETDPAWCAHIRQRFAGQAVQVLEGDWLGRAPPRDVDLVLANPPYDDGQDTEHLASHVDVAADGIAVLNASALHGRRNWDRVWSRLRGRQVSVRHLVQRPPYLGAGGQRDACVVRWGAWMREPATGWWDDDWSHPSDELAVERLER